MNRTCASRRGLSVWTAAFAAAASSLLSPLGFSQSLQWTGGAAGTNTNFETAANWSPSRVTPSASDDLIIATRNGTDPLPATLTTGTSNFTLRSLSFDNAADRFAAGALTVRNSAAIVNLTFSTADVNIFSATNNSLVTINRNSSTNQLTFLLGYSGLGNIHVDGSSSLTINNATISGNGGLRKTGAGTLTLGTENTFTGGLHVLEGIVSFTLHNRLGSSAAPNAAAVVLNGGTLQMTGTTSTSGNNRGMQIGNNGGTIEVTNPTAVFSFNATIADLADESGRLVKTGTGALTLYSTNTYSGGFELQNGTLSINASGSNTSSAVLNSAFGTGTLRLTGGRLISTTDTGRTVRNNTELGGLVTVTSDEVGAQGGFTWSRGASGTTTLIADSTLHIATTVNWSQNISGSFSLTKTGTGTLVLDGSNSYSGGTTISAGSLEGTTSGLQGAITNNAALVFSQTTDGTYAGAISGSGTLTKTGAGTVSLSGTNTHTGLTSLTEGGLAINGSLAGALDTAAGTVLSGVGTIHGNAAISGAHRPGNSPGTQTFAGDLTYNTGATVGWELAANTTTAGNFDQVIVGGTLDFAGATLLSLDFAGTAVDWSHSFWLEDHSWKLYDAAALTNPENLSLVIADWGDAQGDLFSAILSGSTFGLSVNGTDIYLNYTAAIPEPATTAALVGVAALALAAWRRRRIF